MLRLVMTLILCLPITTINSSYFNIHKMYHSYLNALSVFKNRNDYLTNIPWVGKQCEMAVYIACISYLLVRNSLVKSN